VATGTDYKRLSRDRRRAARLCAECGAPSERYRCFACLDKQRIGRRRRALRTMEQRCSICDQTGHNQRACTALFSSWSL
jgi:hypothetical protein